MPITKLTLDDLSFKDYLQLLRQRGYRFDADENERRIPAELGITYEDLAGETWGSIRDRLIKLRGNLIAEAVGPMMDNAGDEVVVGAGVSPEYARKIMAQNNLGWTQFKKDNAPR